MFLQFYSRLHWRHVSERLKLNKRPNWHRNGSKWKQLLQVLLLKIGFFLFFAYSFVDDFLGKTYFANLSLLRSQSLTRVASELRTVSLVLTMARQTVEENLARIHELRAAVARSHESKQEGYRHIEQSCARIRQQLYEKTHGYWKERVVLAVGETVDGFHRDGSVAGYTWKGMEREIDEAVKTTIERVSCAQMSRSLAQH